MVGIGPKGTSTLLRILGIESKQTESTLKQLASGKRINSASDDAAGLAIADGLRANANIAGQAANNISFAISLSDIRDSAASQLGEIEARRGELAAQAANGTLSDSQRQVLNDEYQALGEEAARITESTSFNGKPVFSGESTAFQVGLDGSESSSVILSGVDATSLVSQGDLLTQDNARAALTSSREAGQTISQVRGEAGSTVSRIEVALANVQTQRENSLAAESRIRDADIAKVAADNVASRIRTEFGIEALRANNLSASNVLSLLS